MHSLIESVEKNQMKKKVTDVKSGDTVRVHQKIREGSKERVQVFEGLVIATRRQKSASSSITVRRIASGVGVEKTFLVHSPLIQKIEVVKRSKVRRDKLNYMKKRSGKSARLSAVAFDRDAVNAEMEAETTETEEKTDEAKSKKDESQTDKTDVENSDKKAEEPEQKEADKQKPANEKKTEPETDKSAKSEEAKAEEKTEDLLR